MNRSQWIAPTQPTTEAEFEQMMHALDKHLADLDLHLHQRPVNAASCLSAAYGKGKLISFFPDPKAEDSPPFSAEYLCGRCHPWYAARYGDGIKVLPELGYCIVPLDDMVWRVRLPFFFGGANIRIDRKLRSRPAENVISREPISINVLDCFDGITQAYANGLREDQLRWIEDRFGVAFSAVILLDALESESALYRQARID
jgi:hypothetical protein